MVLPVVPIIVVAGIGLTGWALKEGGEALDSATGLTKWAVIGGGLYVSFAALKGAGVLK